MKTKRIVILLIALVFSFSQLNAQIQIISGLEGGTYDQLSKDIKSVTELPIEITTSGGSLDNYNKLVADNNFNITFLQYDVLQAEELINPKIRENIRILLPLFLDEEIHLITRADAPFKSINDLNLKKVGIGAPTQGTNVTAKTIKFRTGINWTSVEIHSNDAYDALINGKIDAYFYVGGAPVSGLTNIEIGKIKLLPVKHKALKKIYPEKKIDAGTYKWQNKSVKTYAVSTVMVLNTAKCSDDFKKDVEKLYFDIKENVAKLQESGHPKWKDVYYENATINWPYYYIPEKNKTKSGR
ncbi:MAG: TAXI family TRAP transporter solute-binding subunit [Saprospiraceae bacterium]|nr:TAXI family TRAP transporter solute-binding subunit [Saprospiraceae bacterium]